MSQKYSAHVIVKFFYPVAAGIETNIMETYSVLAKKGWDVNIHTTTNTLTEVNTLAKKDTLRGLSIFRYQWNWWGFNPSHMDTTQPRLVCLHNFNIFPHFWIMLQTLWLKLIGQKNYALILTPHGGFTPEWSTFSLASKIVKWLYHRTFAVLLVNLSVDGVRAVSTWEKREMEKYGIATDKIEVISNGIENQAFENITEQVSAEYKKKIKKLGRYLIQIGRIHPIKNFTTSISVLAKLPKDVKLVIAGPVGDPEYLEQLKVQAKELGLSDRVIFFGVIRGAEKFYLFNQAQLMLHMAIWESYCNVVHEAMSQGLVCVVADNTALPLLIKEGKNGYCLPTYDVDAIANRVNYVLENKNSKEISEIEEHNRTEVVAHSWVNVAYRLHDYYQKLKFTS